LKTIVDVEVKVFVVDEMANMMSYSKKTQDIALNGIKYLMNHHQRPIVLGATPEVYQVIKVDPQIRNRFKLLILRRLEPDEEMAEFLRNWEKCLPLRKASKLDEKKLMAAIHMITQGLVGDIVEALKMAAKYAIGRGEAITVEVLDEMGWVTQEDNDEAVRSL
jgi:AAA+ superfamily predicted ATPase